MSFAHPKVFWFAAALLPLLALFFWVTWRKRQELIGQFVQNEALAQLALGVSLPRQKGRRLLLIVGVAFLLLGMAGPLWGFTWEEASQRGRDIIVAIDTSRSMLATDVQPDRLTRAKLAALDLLSLGKFDRFGLIAFAGSAFLQCPLTFDDEAFRQSVQILQPGIIPQGGTALAEAIQSARDAFGTDAEENHKILILFTDGEDHEEQVTSAAERAAAEGVRIFTVGVGTAGGELLRVRDEQGNLAYVKDEEGNVVKSRLNEQLLREIATTGKGFYLPLQGGNAMDVLYQKGLAPLPTSERSSKLTKRSQEQFYWPLGLGLYLLILEIFIPEQARLGPKAPLIQPQPPKTALPVATAAVLLLLSLVPGAQASAAQAQRHYNAKEYKSALSEYQELLGRKPQDAPRHYNAGAAAYQAAKFDEAIKQFEAAAASPDLDLQQQSFYNLGNSEFRLGEADSNPQQRIATWEQAVQHYDAARKLNPQDKDAEFNRNLVQKRLEELKQQKQKNKSQQQNKNSENKDEQKDQKDQPKKGDQKQQDNQSDQQKKQDQQNNESDQNKEKQKGDEQKKQDGQNQQQQQPEASQEKKDGKDQQEKQGKPDQANQGSDSQNAKPEGDDSAAQYAQLGKMSPAQAKQLLDAQRGEEKALLFIPHEKKGPAQPHAFKDW